LSGPAEELWFAAAIAALVLLTRNNPKVRFWVALIGGGLLRVAFHVYQGWVSVGLFFWGAVVAVAVAWTGRWLILFILHFVTNFAINMMGMPNFVITIYLLLVCCTIYWVSSRRRHSGRRHGGVNVTGSEVGQAESSFRTDQPVLP